MIFKQETRFFVANGVFFLVINNPIHQHDHKQIKWMIEETKKGNILDIEPKRKDGSN